MSKQRTIKTTDLSEIKTILLSECDHKNCEWGRWECSKCETEHDDPDCIHITCCGGNGGKIVHEHRLGPVEEDGTRCAWYISTFEVV